MSKKSGRRKKNSRSKSPGTTLLALFSYLFAALFVASFAAVAWQVMIGLELFSMQMVPFFAAMAVFSLLGMLFSYLNVRKTKGTAGELLLFSTWFPLLMSLVPIAGPFLSLYG